MNIVHTHRHGEFSLLDGVGTAEQYVARAVELGQTALAVTDHGTLGGALHHYKACREAGVIPILGAEVYFKPNRLLKDAENKEFYHLVLLAKDLKGWHNLMRITSEAYQSGFYYKPCIDFELLEKYSEGLICTTACMSSYLCKSITRGDDCAVRDTLAFLKKTFKEDLFVEIMPHDFDDQRVLNVELSNIANEHGIPLIATVDAHYPYQEWADTQDVVLMMATGQTQATRKKKKDAGEDVYTFDCNTLYLMSREDVEVAFDKNHPHIPKQLVTDSIDNTLELANRIVPFMISKRQKMPKIQGDSEKIVREWCELGFEERDIGRDDDAQYRERMEYELSIIKKNGALDYFALVGDLCRWAQEQGIRIGAGRGSAAGCLVSYLIGITQLDPIKHDLLFERFMNPDRKGMPDIDLDFQSDRRDEVKAYVSEKYGEDHVADICSHQTYQTRAALQKVSRVFDLYRESHDVTETIGDDEDVSLERLAEVNPSFTKYKEDHPEVWKHACRVQGQVHTMSKHAAGVVITDRPITEYMPVMAGKKGEVVTQWGASSGFNIIDEYGFPKIDFLGIKGLAMQEYACDLIEKNHGVRPNLNELPIMKDPRATDPEVLEAFGRGLVLGVFQFTGSRGFAQLIKSFKPDWLGDLCAANAIYRPGPLGGGVDKSYADRKFGREQVSYFHESAEEVLIDTYGLIVYQEQIMKLAQRMGNFTGGEADDLRKAISKEYRNGMAHVIKWLDDRGYKEKWFQGCRDNGIKDAVAAEVWRLIIAFGDYGFNKSHARSYSSQSYQDMWLKVFYPPEFYAALLSYRPDLARRVVRESRMFDVAVRPPDINRSGFDFSVDNQEIIFGLKGVKNLGDVAVREVLEKQPYRSYEDFEERVVKRSCNKRCKESLVAAGAFDSFGKRKEWTPEEKNISEREILGVCISQAQLVTKYRDVIARLVINEDDFRQLSDGAGVTVGGEMVNSKEITTRGGKKMAFVDVQFGSNQWSTTLFPDVWTEYRPIIITGDPIFIRGRKDSSYNGKPTVIADSIATVEEVSIELANRRD